MFFCDEHRVELKKAHPEFSMINISKELSKTWEEISADDKKVVIYSVLIYPAIQSQS